MEKETKETREQILTKIQSQAVNDVGTSGTILVATGVGKTFIALQWLLKYVPVGSHVIFYAETVTRENTLHEECKKFKKIFKKDILKDYKLEFRCYQSGYKKCDAAIFDEIDYAVTPEYSKCIVGEAKYKLGVTGTLPNIPFDPTDEKSIDKASWIHKELPVKFIYSRGLAIRDGILSPYEIYTVHYMLDNTVKNLDVGTKAKPRLGTELEYNTKFENGRRNFTSPKMYKLYCGKKLTKLFSTTTSPVEHCKKLLTTKEKTIVFAVDLDLLSKVVPANQIISSRNTKAENDKIISDFNKGKITTIGSFKMLIRGITLDGVERCILLTYFSKEHLFDQMIGRVIRFKDDKLAKVYIYVCPNTLQEKWYNEMLKNVTVKNTIQYYR